MSANLMNRTLSASFAEAVLSQPVDQMGTLPIPSSFSIIAACYHGLGIASFTGTAQSIDAWFNDYLAHAQYIRCIGNADQMVIFVYSVTVVLFHE